MNEVSFCGKANVELITPVTWREGAQGQARGDEASPLLRMKEKLGWGTAALVCRAVAAPPWLEKETVFLLQLPVSAVPCTTREVPGAACLDGVARV